MVFLRFTVITHEYVSRKTTVRYDATDSSHTVEIPLAGIFAVHQFQYPITSALHRQMYMLAHVGHLSNNPQRLVAHILRMRRGESDAHLRSLKRHSAEKIGEATAPLLLPRGGETDYSLR